MKNELILDSKGVLLVPCVEGKPLVIDLKEIFDAEKRGHELTGVTMLKAPELLYTFSRALSDTKTAIAWINGKAWRPCKRAIDSRVAVIVLDEAKRILEDKGLATSRTPGGSADLRKVVVDADPEIKRLRDILDQIEAAIEQLDIKAKDFERLYFSVQKVVDPRSHGPHRDLSGDTGTNDVGEEERLVAPRKRLVDEDQPETPELDLSGFGEAKF